MRVYSGSARINIQNRITDNYYQMSLINMSENDSRDILLTFAMSIANLIKLIDKTVGDKILVVIDQLTTQHSELLKRHPENRSRNALSRERIRNKYETDIDNDLKIDLCNEISELIGDNEILM